MAVNKRCQAQRRRWHGSPASKPSKPASNKTPSLPSKPKSSSDMTIDLTANNNLELDSQNNSQLGLNSLGKDGLIDIESDFDSESQDKNQSGLDSPAPAIIERHINHPENINTSAEPIFKTKRQLARIHQKWEQLKVGIDKAEAYYNSQSTSNSHSNEQYATLLELCEYNNLLKELNLKSRGSCSIEASKSVSKASLRWKIGPESGVGGGTGHAARIRKQASYLMIHGRLIEPRNGRSTKHPSILDDPEILQMIKDWLPNYKVGKVCTAL